jgi:S-formylglutathione hydrolase FrmB
MFGLPLDTPLPTPAPGPTSPPTLRPAVPPQEDLRKFNYGIDLLGGWFPLTVGIIVLLLVVMVIGWRTRRWRRVWLPVCVGIGAIGALAVTGYLYFQSLPSDPPPLRLWLWIGIVVCAIAIAVLGWRSAGWWRRALSVLVIPPALVATLLLANQWLGYYRTLPAAWDALTTGPLPDEVDPGELGTLRNSVPSSGKLVKVTIPDAVSGFKHRPEYVYLPPAWFAGSAPPALPAVMMIAGEFDPPVEWIRSGLIVPVIDGYAHTHGGQAPILVFVDPGGVFNNDTECVNGPRGNQADYLTKELRPYVISRFGASSAPAQWAVVGWSMGGTCAIDLTVMHPDLFSTFQDIAGDHGPTAGTKQQTIDGLYGGDRAQWDAFDPRTVMAKHGPYTGVSGWFEDDITTPPDDPNPSTPGGSKKRSQPIAPQGYGGHDEIPDNDEMGAARDLCSAATAVNISCSTHSLVSVHNWALAALAFRQAMNWIAAQIHTPAAGGAV